jgi:hypothetical protein
MQRLGLREEYITTFPLQIPAPIASSPNLPSGIKGLQVYLDTLVSSLNTAVNILRKARTNHGYRHVNQNKKILAKKLFIDTEVVLIL